MSDDDNSSSNAAADHILFRRMFGQPQSYTPPPAAKNQDQPYIHNTRKYDYSNTSVAKPVDPEKKKFHAKLAIVGALSFAAVLLCDNSNILHGMGKIPGLRGTMQSATNPEIKKLGKAEDISFTDQDPSYLVTANKTCLHMFAARNKPQDITSICFDRGQEVRGVPVYPFNTQEKPSMLAVQVRHTDHGVSKAIANAYIPLDDLKPAKPMEAVAAPLPVSPTAKTQKAPANKLNP